MNEFENYMLKKTTFPYNVEKPESDYIVTHSNQVNAKTIGGILCTLLMAGCFGLIYKSAPMNLFSIFLCVMSVIAFLGMMACGISLLYKEDVLSKEFESKQELIQDTKLEFMFARGKK